jgi:hypothetical protein
VCDGTAVLSDKRRTGASGASGRLLDVIALALCIWLPLQDAPQLLSEGINAYDAMELDLAREKLTAARKNGAPSERARADLWLGVVELERGRDAAARRSLRAALQADPNLEVPQRLSPKVRALVEELRPVPKEPTQETQKDTPKPREARERPRARASTRGAGREPAARIPVMLPAPVAVLAAAPAPPVATEAPAPPPSATMVEAAAPAPPEGSPLASESAAAGAPVDGAVTADAGTGTLSPFVVLAAGGGALAATGLVAAVALGVSAKMLEAEAAAAPRAANATAAYEQAAGSALVANALFVGSGLAAVGGAACAGLWIFGGGAE